jgi:hypothetical protein
MTKAYRVNVLLGLLFQHGGHETTRLLDQISRALAKYKMEQEGIESFRQRVQQSR